nr:PREDICTED: storkhead-box protein 1 isoform X2 [Latimeria chalumnae]|eukprot:XP_014344632.1 PREDICTED: storkhead-box protein 1 isoform X2 [Latimeria chalumnae]
MTPITQSQFIPLAEVLCSAISDMNAAHTVVTQETLMDHLVKYYPGIATPTQEILYNALGALIKERKIYHTGEGYFIVTPQTYFITNSVEGDHPSPSPVTYLVSMENGVDKAKEEVPAVSHCKSCSCFIDLSTQKAQGQPSITENNGKGQKCSKQSKPLVQNQATSTSLEHQTCDTSKASTLGKEKEKSSKKFAFNLFKRSTVKKDKPKKEYATFSAQFPPEEWPVRDEDNLDNIPRAIEHEIIKRINPVLTVDNLMKHTILMKKLENQKCCIDKGTSTEMLVTKQKYQSKVSARRFGSKTAKHRRKGHTNRDKQKVKSKIVYQSGEIRAASEKLEKHTDRQYKYIAPEKNNANDAGLLKKQIHEEVSAVEPLSGYKKQIDNPFLGMTAKDGPSTRGHRVLNKGVLKGSRTEKHERGFHRSKSLDSSKAKAFNNEAKQPVAERYHKSRKRDSYHDANLDLRPVKESFQEYPENSSYPDCSTLRMEDKYKHLRESTGNRVPDTYSTNSLLQGNLPAQTVEQVTGGVVKEEAIHPLPQVTYQCEKTAVLYQSPCQTSNPCQNSALSRQVRKCARSEIRIPEHIATQKQYNDLQNGLVNKNTTMWSEANQLDSEGFTDDDQALYQKPIDDDACSSLYLNDEYEDLGNVELSQLISGHIQNHCTKDKVWKNADVQNGSQESQDNWSHRSDMCESSAISQGFELCYQHEPQRWRQSLGNGLDNSKHGQQQNCENEHCGHHASVSQFTYDHLEEAAGQGERVESLEMVDASIFDYCHTSEGDSDAETLQKSLDENDGNGVHWNMDQQTEELRASFEQKLELLNTQNNAVLRTTVQAEPVHIETENHSITGDSGIDSPRTRVSLSSNNSVSLEGLKRRSFLQNLETLNNNSRSSVLLTQNPLLQLTPVMNV